MASSAERWARLRAEGRWVELWADVRVTGTTDELAAIADDLSPEERSADNAEREAQRTSEHARARLSAIASEPLDSIYLRIEQNEGVEQRELAEAGRKLAEAGTLYASSDATI